MLPESFRKAALVLTITCIVLSGYPAAAQEVAPDLAQALATIRGEKILGHVTVLASDKFEGRAPGTAGEVLTVDYIASELKKAGVEPGNPDGSYVQRVPLVGFNTTAAIDLKIEGKPFSLKFMDDFVHDYPRLVPEVNAKFREVVFVGYGITSQQFVWDDYKGVDVRGKLVVALSGEPSRPDKADAKKADTSFFKGGIRTYYSSRDYKFEEARKRGALGLLVVTNPEKAQTYSLFQTFARMEGMALKPRAADHSLAVAGLVTTKAIERLFSSAGLNFAHAESGAELTDFKPISLRAPGTLSITSRLRDIASHNVVARIEGSDPVLKNELVIYSAHWDHLGKDSSLTGDQIFNGANDNAAGVAQFIEVGRAFASLKKRPKRSVLLIATTAEEKGFLGARHYTRNPLYPIRQTVAAINLDAGNLYGLTKDLASTGHGNSSLDDALATAASMQGRIFLKGSLDNGGLYFGSDQIEFAVAGIPAVFPWSGNEYVGKPPDFGEKAWGEYGTKRYHQVSDEVMPDWDMTGAVEDARWMMLAGWLVANGDERPKFSEGSEFLWIGKKRKNK